MKFLKNNELFWQEVLEHAGVGHKSTTSIPMALDYGFGGHFKGRVVAENSNVTPE